MGAEAPCRLDVNQIPEHQYYVFRLLADANSSLQLLQNNDSTITALHMLLLCSKGNSREIDQYEAKFRHIVEQYCRDYIAISECLRSAIEYSDEYDKNIFTAEESQFIWNVSAEIFKTAKDIWAFPHTMKGFEKHHTAWQTILTKIETIVKPHFNTAFKRLKTKLIPYCRESAAEIHDTRDKTYKQLGLALGPMFRDKRHFQYT